MVLEAPGDEGLRFTLVCYSCLNKLVRRMFFLFNKSLTAFCASFFFIFLRVGVCTMRLSFLVITNLWCSQYCKICTVHINVEKRWLQAYRPSPFTYVFYRMQQTHGFGSSVHSIISRKFQGYQGISGNCDLFLLTCNLIFFIRIAGVPMWNVSCTISYSVHCADCLWYPVKNE